MNIQTIIAQEKNRLPEGACLLVSLFTDREFPQHLVVKSVSGSAIVSFPTDASASTAKSRITGPEADSFMVDVSKPIMPTTLVNSDHVRSAHIYVIPSKHIGPAMRDILQGNEQPQEWIDDGFSRHPK